MNAQLTHAETFIVELGRAGITLRLTSAISYNVHRAIAEQGWTVEQLVAEAERDLNTAANVPAVITDRMKVAATVPPAKPKGEPKRQLPNLALIHKAGVCCDGYGIVYDETVDPPTQTMCRGVTG